MFSLSFLPKPALRVAFLLGLACAPAVLLVPGCGGGGSGGGSVRLVSRSTGTVALNNGQTGTLDLRLLATGRGTGTFVIANAPLQPVQAQPTYRVGTYTVGGVYIASENKIRLTGTIPGAGFFTIDVIVPTSSSNGSFTVALGSQTFGPAPFTTYVTPTPTFTATATATGTATATATATAVPNNTIPTSTNGAVTGTFTGSGTGIGSSATITNGAFATAIQNGSNQLNLQLQDNSNGNTRIFGFNFSKQSAFKTGDTFNFNDTDSGNVGTLIYNFGGSSGAATVNRGSFKIVGVTATNFTYRFSDLRFVPTGANSSFTFGSGSGTGTITR